MINSIYRFAPTYGSQPIRDLGSVIRHDGRDYAVIGASKTLLACVAYGFGPLGEQPIVVIPMREGDTFRTLPGTSHYWDGSDLRVAQSRAAEIASRLE